MKKIILYILLLTILGCTNSNSKKECNIKNTIDYSIKQFPNKWEKLTKIDSEYVIFKPCDEANSNFSLYQENKIWILAHEQGHETYFDTLIKIVERNNDFTLYLKPEYGKGIKQIFITSYKNNVAHWKCDFETDKFDEYCVSSKGISQYKTIKQPCRECWDEHICNEKEKELDQYFNVKLYKDIDTIVSINYLETDLIRLSDFNYQRKSFDIDENKLISENDSFKLIIESSKFDTTKHSLSFSSSHKGILERIDNHKIYGTDGNVPVRIIKNIQIEYANDTLIFPINEIEDLYEPNLELTRIYQTNNGRIIIWMSNSDGAGGYYVIWIIKNYKIQKRIIGYGF